ncbi:MAG: potassium transporter Kup [Betaproteobacteria bacterium]|nr:MAG: potassium transporter Kup [Betaproteobacteria bacterium]
MTSITSGGSSTNGKSSLTVLTLAALGVVYGDIGTSPLYAFKEAFSGPHGLPLTEANVLAVLSMMLWSITLIVSLKYVSIVLRFDNGGEGGILALLALATRLTRARPRLARTVAVIGIFGASLFYGDAIITPAISVLSAVEGISVATPALEHWIVPITIAILVGLFAMQRRGTGALGKLFGRITVLWFLVLAVLGAMSIAQTPAVLAALDPRHALGFAWHSPGLTFLVLGAVFLAITGAEALYADMGHFGATPVRLAWFGLVFPSLMINYFGQGALALRDPAAMKNPFYLLAPQELLMPLVLLATAATIIASQATISGAFSVTHQATRLGYLPRVPTLHTSETERGQIYIPQVNWIMLVLVIMLVLAFKTSGAIASAYGIAVSGTMVLTTALVAIVAFSLQKRPNPLLFAVLALIGLVELVFFAANATKIADGGWFPLACGLALFILLTTWKRAETILTSHERSKRVPLDSFATLCSADIPRVSGTAVYLSPDLDSVPTVMMHNLKHNKVLHQRIVFLTILNEDVPHVADLDRTGVRVIERAHAYQATLRYGFMEQPDVPKGLKLLERHGLKFEALETTFFLGKATLARAVKPGLFTWRRELFRWMQRNSPATAEYFGLLPERVIELGTRVTL